MSKTTITTAKRTAAQASPQTWTYDTAPGSPILADLPINSRQLRRWTEQGKVDHLKIGHRVYFTEEHLLALVESLTVKAVR